MAFVAQEDENKNQPAAQAQATTASAPGAGPASSAGKSSAPQAAPSQPFQNLSAYLTANAPQIQNQANQLSTNLTNQYGQIQGDINKGKTDFQNQITQNYAQPNNDLVSQAASNPTAFVQNPDNVKAFQSLYNDAYAGPANYESTGSYADLNNEVMNAVSKANAVNTTGGLQTYFQGQNPTGTAGGNVLDSVLLQASPDAYTQVQNAAKPFSNLNDYLSQAVTENNTGITNAQNAAQGVAQNVQSKFTGEGGVIPSFQSGLEKKVNDLEQNREKFNAAYNNFSAPSKAINDALNAYNATVEKNLVPGVSATLQNQFAPLAGYNPILNAISTENAATPEDLATQQALNSLTGSNLNAIPNELNPVSVPDYPQDFKSMVNNYWDMLGKLPQYGGKIPTETEMQYQPQIQNLESAGNNFASVLQKYLNGG